MISVSRKAKPAMLPQPFEKKVVVFDKTWRGEHTTQVNPIHGAPKMDFASQAGQRQSVTKVPG